jgi:hypothetical protein
MKPRFSRKMIIIAVLMVINLFFAFFEIVDTSQHETVILPPYNHATAIAEIYTMTVSPLTPTPSNVIYITMTPTPGIYYPGGVTHHAGVVMMTTPRGE